MIALTCDVHHAALRTANQFHCDASEVAIAARFAAMLRETQIKATFFVSGRTFADEWPALAPICDSEWIELGGHNYGCFAPALPHRVWNKVAGSYPGPRWLEERDVSRTIEIAWRRTGRRLRAWRNHMYLGGPHTARVLAAHGLAVLSDGVDREAAAPTADGGVWRMPINVLPDHEHIIHAERTRSWVARWQRRYRWRDDFGANSYDVDEWTEHVLEDLERNRARGATSVMLIHPITLYLADRLRSVRRILDVLTTSPTRFISELVPVESSP